MIAGYFKNSGNASRLKGNERVLKRIEEIRSQAAECVVINKAWVLQTLRDNALIAMGFKKKLQRLSPARWLNLKSPIAKRRQRIERSN